MGLTSEITDKVFAVMGPGMKRAAQHGSEQSKRSRTKKDTSYAVELVPNADVRAWLDKGEKCPLPEAIKDACFNLGKYLGPRLKEGALHLYPLTRAEHCDAYQIVVGWRVK